MKLSVTVLLFLISLSVYTQDYIVSLQQWTEEDGLSHRDVRSIYQDSRGFMWLGTSRGLNRFDGYEFRRWTREDGLPTQTVTIAAEDSEGYLWVLSTDENKIIGVTLIDIRSGELMSYQEKFGGADQYLPTDIKSRFLKSSDGTIYYLNSVDNKLIAYHHESGFKAYDLDYDHPLELISLSSEGTLWADRLTQGDSYFNQTNSPASSLLYEDEIVEIGLNGEIIKTFPHKSKIGKNRIFTWEGDLWFSAEISGADDIFCQIENRDLIREYSKDEMNGANDFGSKPDFIRLYGLDSMGILSFQYGSIKLYRPESGVIMDVSNIHPQLKEDQVLGERGFFTDRSGAIWLGGDFGVYKLRFTANPFNTFLSQKLDRDKNENKGIACRDIIRYEDQILVATEGQGVQILSDDKDALQESPGMALASINNFCWSLGKDGSGGVYSGAYPYLLRIDPTKKTSEIILEADKKNLSIWSIYQDSTGILWLGDGSGLKTMNPEENLVKDYHKYNQYSELASSSIMDIHPDRYGSIWLSSESGFYLLDPGQGIMERYWSGGEGPSYIPTDRVRHFHDDADGVYWLATADNGLIRWDKRTGKATSFTMTDGLSNDVIHGVYEDDFNNLWMSSDYGLMRFNKTSFEVQSYLERDGISHNEFNRVSHFKDSDGSLYFGGLNGVTSFHPRDFINIEKTLSHALRITYFHQFDADSNALTDKTNELLSSHTIIINPADRFFELGFSLLSYEESKRQSYSWKIDGIESNWVEQYENYLRLSRLPYGSHQLVIRAKEANGQTSSNDLLLNIKVLKPFYLQYWFLFLALLFLSLLVYAIISYLIGQNRIATETTRIKEIDLLKSRFYTYISHEFRTPLTIIMGMADKMVTYPEEQRIIKRSSENLLQFVNQMLDLSKLDSGNMAPEYLQSDIIAFIADQIEPFFTLASAKGIQLTMSTNREQLIMDYDGFFIQQIVNNLMSNAIKFTPAGGQVSVSLEHIKAKSDNDSLLILIEDTGRGIDESEMARVFDHFYQAAKSGTRKEGGSGVGLALTKELVTLLKGDIKAESKLGEGTAFSIELPVTHSAPLVPYKSRYSTKPAEGEVMVKARKPSKKGAIQLLIVEDNKDMARYVRSCIPEEYRIHHAYDGKEGLKAAYHIIPDIIITDLMMPEMDGHQLISLLKNDQRTSHIPIIMLTAKSSLADKLEGIEAGADVYLVKPFNQQELQLRLDKLLELRRNLQKYYSSLIEYSPETRPDKNAQFMADLQQFILKNMHNEKLGIEDICSEFSMSASQLFRKVKAMTGDTPIHLVQSLRLSEALNLLQSDQQTVAEVAYKVGYSNPNYFSRLFSKTYGYPPSAAKGKHR